MTDAGLHFEARKERAGNPLQSAARFKPMLSNNGKVALAFAQRGFAVFPCSQDKRPVPGIRWSDQSTIDQATITDWWSANRNALVALDLAKSGLVVIDADRHGGPDGVAALQTILGDEFHALGCPITNTSGNGLHLFFAQPSEGDMFTNRRGALPPGIDVRGAGGYVIAPGSVRADGSGWFSDPAAPELIRACYEFPVPDLPDVLAQMIRAPKDQRDHEKKSQPKPMGPTVYFDGAPDKRGAACAKAALAKIVADLASAAQGGRNNMLNACAFDMGRMIAVGWIDQSLVFDALEGACQANGLVKDDGMTSVRKTITSGLNGGIAKPHEGLADRNDADSEASAYVDALFGFAEKSQARTTRDPHEPFEQSAQTEEEPPQAEDGKAGANPLAGFTFHGDAPSAPPAMLVKGLVPETGICFIGGQSGAGKTYVAVDLAVSLASGASFFGRPIKQRVGVAIFAAEGANTIPNRVNVAAQHKASGELLPISWLGAVPNLAELKEVKAMIARLRLVDQKMRETYGVRLGVVICDTLVAAFSLEDENSNSEAAKVIRSMKMVVDALGVTVMPVHHYGKMSETGLRGASAWRGGCDTVIAVIAKRDETTGSVSNRRLCLTKSRVGEEGEIGPFELRAVYVGEDDDGEKIYECVVEPGQTDGEIHAPTPKGKRMSSRAKNYIRALEVVLIEKGRKVRPYGSEGPEVRAADRADVRKEYNSKHPSDGDDPKKKAAAQQKAFKRAEDDARDGGLIVNHDLNGQEIVWQAKGSDK